MRGLRSEQGEQEGSDFVTVLNACQKKYFPAADLHDWPARYNTIKRLAEDMVKEFRKKAPAQANQTLLTRLQALESENARLRSQSSRSTRADPVSNHARRVSTPKTRSAPPPIVEGPHDDEDGAALDEHPLESPDEENPQDPGPTAAEDTYEQYLPKSDSVASLKAATLRLQPLKESMHGWPRQH